MCCRGPMVERLLGIPGLILTRELNQEGFCRPPSRSLADGAGGTIRVRGTFPRVGCGPYLAFDDTRPIRVVCACVRARGTE